MSFLSKGLSTGGDFGGAGQWGKGAGMDPMLSAGAMVLGSALRGTPAGPAISSATQKLDQVFDNSGWVVTMGDKNATDTQLDRTTDKTDSSGLSMPSGMMGYALVALAGVILWKKYGKR